MYKSQLQQIANILNVNCQRASQFGLLKGKLGIALFFYHYARFSKEKYYEEIADALLDDSINNAKKQKSISFSNGILGLGWCLKYLERNSFIELENDMLNPIMQIAKHESELQAVMRDLKNDIPSMSKGLFLTIDVIDDNIINNCLKDVKWCLECSNINDLDLPYINSLIFVLKKISTNKSYKTICEKYMAKAYKIGEKIILSNNCDKMHVFVFANLSQEYKKNHEIDFDLLYDVYMNWQTIVYKDFMTIEEALPEETLNSFLYSFNMKVPQTLLSLDGISSLGINLIRFLEKK